MALNPESMQRLEKLTIEAYNLTRANGYEPLTMELYETAVRVLVDHRKSVQTTARQARQKV